MEPYEDPNHDGNAPRHQTGKLCIEKGCFAPAGTAWSPYWCRVHNAERMSRITKSLEDIQDGLRRKSDG